MEGVGEVLDPVRAHAGREGEHLLLRFAICAGVGWPPLGKSFWQTLRADWNAGELGSMPIPEWIVITPWPFGSGKFGTPCLRMQAENFAPSAVPTFIAIWNWPPGPPPEPPGALSADPEPLRVVVVAAVAGGGDARNPGGAASAAATSGREQYEGANRETGGEDDGTAATHVFSSFSSERIDCQDG